MIYSKQEIYAFLKKTLLGVLVVRDEPPIAGLVTFAADEKGNFFIVTRRPAHYFFTSEKTRRPALFVVYKEEEELEDMHELIAIGEAELFKLDNIPEDVLVEIYSLFEEKSPLISSLSFDKERRKDYTIIKFNTAKMLFEKMDDVFKGESPTLLVKVG